VKSFRFHLGIAMALSCMFVGPASHGQQINLEREPACQTLKPASTGGPMPENPAVMVLRYYGTAAYEVDYHGKIFLIDPYYDGSREPDARKIGLKASDIIRADFILVGHPHFDHIADAPAVSKQTGAMIFVSPPGLPVLEKAGITKEHYRIVSGGEDIKMDGFRILTGLARHSAPEPGSLISPEIGPLFKKAYTAASPPSPEEIEWWKHLEGRVGTMSPDVIDKGTIAYVVIFDSGFKLALKDSPNQPTAGERELMQKAGGHVDLGILNYQGYWPHQAVPMAMNWIQLYNPSIFVPAHQEEIGYAYGDIGTRPLFETFRDKMPNTKGIDPLMRAPICINTKTDDFFNGMYIH
jgi:hypothetical protein